MVNSLLELIDAQSPGRRWVIGQTRSQAVHDVLDVTLRALMLFTLLACFSREHASRKDRQ